jgi:hypothetical protein
MGGGRSTRGGSTSKEILSADASRTKLGRPRTSRSTDQRGCGSMDNLRAICLGVVSSLIAAGIIAFAKYARRCFNTVVRAIVAANLTFHTTISRWLIINAVHCLPDFARSRFRDEWLAHLNELGPPEALRHAMSCAFRIPSLRRALRDSSQIVQAKSRSGMKFLINTAGALTIIAIYVLDAPGPYFESPLGTVPTNLTQQSTNSPSASLPSSLPSSGKGNVTRGVYSPPGSLADAALHLNDDVYTPPRLLSGNVLSLNSGILNPSGSLTNAALHLNDAIYAPPALLASNTSGLNNSILSPSGSLTDAALHLNDAIYTPPALLASNTSGLNNSILSPSGSLTDAALHLDDAVYTPPALLASNTSGLNDSILSPSGSLANAALHLDDAVYTPPALLASNTSGLNNSILSPSGSLTNAALHLNDAVYTPPALLGSNTSSLNNSILNSSGSLTNAALHLNDAIYTPPARSLPAR